MPYQNKEITYKIRRTKQVMYWSMIWNIICDNIFSIFEIYQKRPEWKVQCVLPVHCGFEWKYHGSRKAIYNLEILINFDILFSFLLFSENRWNLEPQQWRTQYGTCQWTENNQKNNMKIWQCLFCKLIRHW